MQQEIWFGKYRIIRLLGSGGTARVYLAQHIALNSYRAIKCISKNNPLYHQQRKEALLLKNLKHPCIPIIYDIEEDEEGSCIVEQYLEGETLKEYISLRGPVREDLLVRFAIQLCDLIGYLHEGDRPILYVDLKPDNIIVSDGTLKLVDFGSAVYQDELTGEQDYTGTRGYAAPELYGRAEADERCDVYGIGMLMLFMATGCGISQETRKISNIDGMGSYSRQLKTIINRCLKFHPAARYASVAQLKKQLVVRMKQCRAYSGSSQPLAIAVAGAQPRAGVTHLAFRLCRYLEQKHIGCLYLEKNQSGCIRSLLNYLDNEEERDGYCHIEGIPVLAQGGSLGPEPVFSSIPFIHGRSRTTTGFGLPLIHPNSYTTTGFGPPFIHPGSYMATGFGPSFLHGRSRITACSGPDPAAPVTVSDYGCLTPDNLEDFRQAGIKLLVMGAKPWELAASEEILNMVAEYKDILYLFNFLNGRQFHGVTDNMEHKSCYRIPYEPDPFAGITDQGSRELFDELLGLQKTGIGQLLRRRGRN